MQPCRCWTFVPLHPFTSSETTNDRKRPARQPAVARGSVKHDTYRACALSITPVHRQPPHPQLDTPTPSALCTHEHVFTPVLRTDL
jgi:hypothetical protein